MRRCPKGKGRISEGIAGKKGDVQAKRFALQSIEDNPKDGRNWFRGHRPDDAETIGIGREVEA